MKATRIIEVWQNKGFKARSSIHSYKSLAAAKRSYHRRIIASKRVFATGLYRTRDGVAVFESPNYRLSVSIVAV
jgi:UV DNA damage repair endonuclease